MKQKQQSVFFFLMAVIAIAVYFFKSSKTESKQSENPSSSTPVVVSSTTPTLQSPTRPSANPKAASVPAARETAAAKDFAELRSYLKGADPQAEWYLMQARQGYFKSFSGGLIHEDISTSEKALAFGRKIAVMVGVDPQQLIPAESSLPETADNRSMRLQQSVAGYPVFGSSMDIFTRKSDGAIYFLGSEIKPLNQVETRVASSYEMAKNVVSALYSGKTFSFVREDSQPVILVTEAGQGELCWQIEIKITRPLFEKRLLFLSTNDLRVLQNLSLSVKN
jgi:hypothetical protein